MNINLYRRGDGVEFAAEEGSPSDKLMKRDGSFTALREEPVEVDPAELAQRSENEGKTVAKQSPATDGKTAKDPGSNGSGKRGGARGKDKGQDAPVDAEGSAAGENVLPSGDDAGGRPEGSPSRAPEGEGQQQ